MHLYILDNTGEAGGDYDRKAVLAASIEEALHLVCEYLDEECPVTSKYRHGSVSFCFPSKPDLTWFLVEKRRTLAPGVY